MTLHENCHFIETLGIYIQTLIILTFCLRFEWSREVGRGSLDYIVLVWEAGAANTANPGQKTERGAFV